MLAGGVSVRECFYVFEPIGHTSTLYARRANRPSHIRSRDHEQWIQVEAGVDR